MKSTPRLINQITLTGVALIGIVSHLQAQSSNPEFGKTYEWAKPIWGLESNGCSAGLAVTWAYDHFQVDFRIRRPTNAEEFRENRTVDEFLLGPHFLMATNDCIGPMKLEGPHGIDQQPIGPDVMAPGEYPETLNWYTLKRRAIAASLNTRVPGYHGNIFGLDDRQEEGKIAFFNLSRYFKLEVPGDYKLTVWPKLYKKVQKDRDVFQRIDIPPVSFSFHWDGTQISDTPP